MSANIGGRAQAVVISLYCDVTKVFLKCEKTEAVKGEEILFEIIAK